MSRRLFLSLHGQLQKGTFATFLVGLATLAGMGSSAQAEWIVQTIDSLGNVGRFTSLVIDSNGRAHISYQDATNFDLKYANNSSGIWMHETVDTFGSTGVFTSLALDSLGNPHISYYILTSGDLKYASRSGGAWAAETVDDLGIVGNYSSLALDSAGNPHISYYDQSNGDLKHAKKSGGAWTTDTVDSVGTVGLYTSLALDSTEDPHISYFDQTTGSLKYASKSGGVWSLGIVDSSTLVGSYTSLALDSNDEPHISYYESSNRNLRYAAGAVADTTTGTLEWTRWVVDSTGDVGRHTSLVLDSMDNPSISYYDETNSNLKYATLTGDFWTTETVDDQGSVGEYTSLDFYAQGFLGISYYDAFSEDLKYATTILPPILVGCGVLEGTITSVHDPDSHFLGAISVGDTFRAIYKYDPTTPDSDPGFTTGIYAHQSMPYVFVVQTEGWTFFSDLMSPRLTVGVENSIVDSYNVVSLHNRSLYGGEVSEISLLLEDFDGMALNSDSLPASPPTNLGPFETRRLRLTGKSSSLSPFLIEGEVTNLDACGLVGAAPGCRCQCSDIVATAEVVVGGETVLGGAIAPGDTLFGQITYSLDATDLVPGEEVGLWEWTAETGLSVYNSNIQFHIDIGPTTRFTMELWDNNPSDRFGVENSLSVADIPDLVVDGLYWQLGDSTGVAYGNPPGEAGFARLPPSPPDPGEWPHPNWLTVSGYETRGELRDFEILATVLSVSNCADVDPQTQDATDLAEDSGTSPVALISPNPFTQQTRILFEARNQQPVIFEVFGVDGRRLWTVKEPALTGPGRREIGWDGRDQHGKPLPSGIYLYRLRSGRFEKNGKLVLIR